MIRQLLVGLAGLLVAGVGALVATMASPPVIAIAAGGLLVVLGAAAATWAVGA